MMHLRHLLVCLVLLCLAVAGLAAPQAEPVVGVPEVFASSPQGWVKCKKEIPREMAFLGYRFLPPDGMVQKSSFPSVRWIDAGSLTWTPTTETKGDGFYSSLAFTNDIKAAGWPVLAVAPVTGAKAVRTLTFTTADAAPVCTATIKLMLSVNEHTNADGNLDPNTAGDLITTISVGEKNFPVNKPCMALTGYGCGATNEGVIKFSAVPITLPIAPATRYTITIQSAPFAQQFAKHMINGMLVPVTLGDTVTPTAGISTPKFQKIDYVYANGRTAMTTQDLADTAAATGKSLRMAPEKGAAGCVADAYSYPPYPGKYAFTFRMKIDDNTGEAEVVRICAMFPGVQNPWLVIKAKDFTTAKIYQEFTVEGLVPEHAFGAYYAQFSPAAGRAVWWDSVTYTLVEPYPDQRVSEEWYPDFKSPQITRTGEEKLRTHIVHGGAFASSGLREALLRLGKKAPAAQAIPGDIRQYKAPAPRQPGEWREGMFIDHGQVKDRVPGFPRTAEDLAALDLIVLANVPGRALSAPSRILLSDWVKRAGGGLLLTGGLSGLGKGYADGTVLEALLPVELCGVNDTKPAKDGRLLAKDPALALLLGNAPLATRFYQDVKVKPGASVLLSTADGVPLLVEWQVGTGHVAVWTGLPLGSVPDGQTAWWKAEPWPALLAAVLQQIAGK